MNDNTKGTFNSYIKTTMTFTEGGKREVNFFRICLQKKNHPFEKLPLKTSQ